MTEQDFLRQIWRAYDTVTVEGVGTRRVLNVCFPTRSVQIALAGGNREWVRCEVIAEHQCQTGEPDDIATIEALHNRLMAANNRNEDLQRIVSEQKTKMEQWSIGELKKCVNKLDTNLTVKMKTMHAIEAAVARINEFLDSNPDPFKIP